MTLTQQEKEAIYQLESQLEENYHFNRKERSFVFKGKKAFIIDISKRIGKIDPFTAYRKRVIDMVGGKAGRFNFESSDELTKFVETSFSIIANMLDDELMGSVEGYVDHIWQDFDKSIANKQLTKSMESMQLFMDNVTAILGMIDFVVEDSLHQLNEQELENITVQNLISKIIPEGHEVIGVHEITNDGSIKKVVTGRTTCDKPNYTEKARKQIDLSKIKALNTKEI